jgi:hypothetical protein
VRSPTFSSDPPPAHTLLSKWQSPAQTERNPKFFLFLGVVLPTPFPDYSGDPLVSRVSAWGRASPSLVMPRKVVRLAVPSRVPRHVALYPANLRCQARYPYGCDGGG